jgi:hypothetical protein
MALITRDIVLGLMLGVKQPLELPDNIIDDFIAYLETQITKQEDVTATNISHHLVTFVNEKLPDSPAEITKLPRSRTQQHYVKEFEL